MSRYPGAAHCPACASFAASNAMAHCPDVKCTWFMCSCGRTFDTVTGQHYPTVTDTRATLAALEFVA